MRGKIAGGEGGDRSWEELREGGRFGARGEEGGRMSAKKAIYIRQKTAPLALTATSWHHHPLHVCLSRRTCGDISSAPGLCGQRFIWDHFYTCGSHVKRHLIHESILWLLFVEIPGAGIYWWTQRISANTDTCVLDLSSGTCEIWLHNYIMTQQ